jgi:hypothetical protein
MTTKVKVEITQKHMPVSISIRNSKDEPVGGEFITEVGESREFYVYAGQHLVIREAIGVFS